MIRSRSGCCSSISSAIVPCPAITDGSSNGWMNSRSRSSASWRASTADSMTSAPMSSTVAPRSRVRATFTNGVLSGITMWVSSPSNVPCRATPWAWLPADMATTPRPGATSSKRLRAPRSLNEPVYCRFSNLRKTVAPTISLSVWEQVSGVRSTAPSMRWAAAWTSSMVTGAVTGRRVSVTSGR